MPTYTAYPTPTQIGQLEGTQLMPRDDLQATRSVNGTLKVRALYPAPKNAFAVKHKMTLAQFADYRTFYGTYSRTLFDFTFAGDNTVYSNCAFAGPPTYTFSGMNVEVAALLEQR
jgi:hypothetical protein